MKHLKLKPVEMIIFLARGPSRIDEAVDKFNDLTFEQGTLYSRSKGRFTREKTPDEEDNEPEKAKSRSSNAQSL